MPRLLVLLTGGTLMMTAELRTAGGPSGADLVREIPSLPRVADVETKVLFSMDSANVQPGDWITLAREVHGALPRYDGIVVVHGTDTMAYTASALALLLGPVPKPVVLTGSQKPLVDARTDARQNLVAASLVATLRVPEVAIVFGDQALRGVRATKKDAWGFDAFASPHVAPLVDLGLDVEVASHVLPPGELAAFDDRLEPRVLAVRVFPGLDPTLVRAAVRSGVRGLVLEGYGTGNVPLALLPALEDAQAKGVPVVVVSQCLRGFVDLSRYEGGAMAAATGAISAKDMTVEAAVAKLMIGIARHGTGDALRRWFATSIVGERDADA
ncbi:MAG: asparaginase [Labilithrix sp.]|nr:asparaginase [Labilithrix sp.]MCW5816303.1 asparaginase [Labilithrix sp.]